jgi:hypothetical protein
VVGGGDLPALNHQRRTADATWESDDMTLMKDLAWVVLILLLMPLIMAVAFVAVVVILLRSLYRWARGNTTSTSRVAAAEAPSTDWWASLSAWARREKPASPPAPLATPVLVPSYATSRRRRP